MDRISTFVDYSHMPQSYTITHANHFFCLPSWRWDSNVSPFTGYNLWFIASGSGWLTITEPSGNRNNFSLHRGDCFVLSNSCHYDAIHDPSQPLVVPFIIFTGQSDPLLTESYSHRMARDPHFMEGLLTRIIEHYKEGRIHEAEHWLHAALHEVVDDDRHQPAEVVEDKQHIIESFCAAYSRHPEQEFVLDDLAEELGCTRGHAIRLFKKLKGVTPNEFCISSRIFSARNLLKSSSYSIGEIATLLGYTDVHFFSRQFKKRMGVSPGHFRKS